MLHPLLTALVVLALVSWLSAVVHAVLLLPHRQDGETLWGLAVRGHRFWMADTWKPSGRELHRRFLGSMGAFGTFVVLTALIGALATASG